MFGPPCSVSHFTNLKRPSDITLGDFWGCEKVDPNFNADNRGCSLVLVNTGKGERLFQTVQGTLNFIETHPDTMSLARRLADQIQGEIVELRSAIHLFHPTPAQCASPESFVGYFREAACVVTTSFHGTAFSIIFNRPFYTLRLGDQHDARSLSLLKRLSLTDRFVEGKAIEKLTAIDHKPVNACLEKEVIRSEAFLIEALQSRNA